MPDHGVKSFLDLKLHMTIGCFMEADQFLLTVHASYDTTHRLIKGVTPKEAGNLEIESSSEGAVVLYWRTNKSALE